MDTPGGLPYNIIAFKTLAYMYPYIIIHRYTMPYNIVFVNCTRFKIVYNKVCKLRKEGFTRCIMVAFLPRKKTKHRRNPLYEDIVFK